MAPPCYRLRGCCEPPTCPLCSWRPFWRRAPCRSNRSRPSPFVSRSRFPPRSIRNPPPAASRPPGRHRASGEVLSFDPRAPLSKADRWARGGRGAGASRLSLAGQYPRARPRGRAGGADGAGGESESRRPRAPAGQRQRGELDRRPEPGGGGASAHPEGPRSLQRQREPRGEGVGPLAQRFVPPARAIPAVAWLSRRRPPPRLLFTAASPTTSESCFSRSVRACPRWRSR